MAWCVRSSVSFSIALFKSVASDDAAAVYVDAKRAVARHSLALGVSVGWLRSGGHGNDGAAGDQKAGTVQCGRAGVRHNCCCGAKHVSRSSSSTGRVRDAICGFCAIDLRLWRCELCASTSL